MTRRIQLQLTKPSGFRILFTNNVNKEENFRRTLGVENGVQNSIYIICELQGVKNGKMEIKKENIRYTLQFFFDKGKHASEVAEIVNGVYGADTVTANYVQFWFRRFRSGIFDV
ncbi:histone-lysine N-methyltransferase SETMAR [Trichonephila clavipes]|nr:histone-lysine N-methyltransferase SETMAR [Trichonephila clavipes]